MPQKYPQQNSLMATNTTTSCTLRTTVIHARVTLFPCL